jgi:hypothetical protein
MRGFVSVPFACVADGDALPIGLRRERRETIAQSDIAFRMRDQDRSIAATICRPCRWPNQNICGLAWTSYEAYERRELTSRPFASELTRRRR